MVKTKAVIIAMILLVSVITGSGCAVKTPEPNYYIWPQYPDELRIVFLAAYYGREDVETSTFVDTILGKSTAYDFLKPYGVYADAERIYITETNNPSLVILDLQKGRADFVVGGDFGRLGTPIGVVAGQDGNIYVSDAKLGGVYIFDKEGEYLSTLGKRGAFQRPTGLAVDNKLQRLYVADAKADTVHVYSFAGNLLFSFGKSGSGPGGLHSPTNLAVDRRNGNIAVVDTLNTRVQVFDSEGKFIRAFGSLGDAPGTFTRPKGVGIDSDGNIHVADAAFDNIQIFSPEGTLLGFYGTPGLEPGFSFSLPTGVYIDENDKIYVVDQANSRVQLFQYLSEKWKKEHPTELESYRKLQEEEVKKLAEMKKKKKAKK